MLPEFLAFANAGAGKDTFAGFLVKHFDGVGVAMADPMKRFAQNVFGFTNLQLWGPSQERNKLDPRFDVVEGGRANDAEGKRWASPLEYEKVDQRLSKSVYDSFVFDWMSQLIDRDGDPGAAYLNLTHKWWPAVKQQAFTLGGLSARVVLQTLGTEWGRAVNSTLWINNARRTQRKLLAGGFTYTAVHGLATWVGGKYSTAVVTDGRFRNEALEFKAGGATVVKLFNPKDAGEAKKLGTGAHQSEAEQDTIPDHWFDYVIKNDKAHGLERFEALSYNLIKRALEGKSRGRHWTTEVAWEM